MPALIEKRCVQFLDEDEVQFVPHRLEYTPRERFNTWVTSKEFKLSRECTKRLAAKMDERSNPNKKARSLRQETRGLENQTKDGHAKKRGAVAEGLAAVMTEQARQRLEGCKDIEAIRTQYIKISVRYMEAAASRGEADFVARKQLERGRDWKTYAAMLSKPRARRRLSNLFFGSRVDKLACDSVKESVKTLDDESSTLSATSSVSLERTLVAQ
eukprot:Nitzschia sp. Nitz4//scaffold4_size323378//293449//294090//NITZ4_000714-RA/size323378-processed-gene-0.390-mRNA-1//-1//CDS//3329553561//8047//frame0